jgi:hypothetical protein
MQTLPIGQAKMDHRTKTVQRVLTVSEFFAARKKKPTRRLACWRG